MDRGRRARKNTDARRQRRRRAPRSGVQRVRTGEAASRRRRADAAPDAWRGGARAVSMVVTRECRSFSSTHRTLLAVHRRRRRRHRRRRHSHRCRRRRDSVLSFARLASEERITVRSLFPSCLPRDRRDGQKERERKREHARAYRSRSHPFFTRVHFATFRDCLKEKKKENEASNVLRLSTVERSRQEHELVARYRENVVAV